ncbi:hypothetical protein NON20_23675 (plasmid) [Synechocystis sp. B12]|nr:hypothetical protein NON20_23675 [Synechocystis sp. B12]
MAELNLTPEQHDALEALDRYDLGEVLDLCQTSRSAVALLDLRLDRCGAYVAAKARAFEREVARAAAAKSAKKCSATAEAARRAASDLEFAIEQMRGRSKIEKSEREFFYVDDHIAPPLRATDWVRVVISYRWRPRINDAWSHGTITFTYQIPNERLPAPDLVRPTRKRSPRQRQQDREAEFYSVWQHLKMLGLHAVRNYLREHWPNVSIPSKFEARADGHTGVLNNFSANFWRPE